jgi:hypothetical protein
VKWRFLTFLSYPFDSPSDFIQPKLLKRTAFHYEKTEIGFISLTVT